ncbi:MAG: methylated-DNA--[protein]-cysteine S-methyltransferase [Bdellovibrio sp.]
MSDLEFHIYKVPSPFGDWLAAFDQEQLIYLGNYNLGKKLVEGDLAQLFKKHYGFDVGPFTPAPWTKGDFWKKKPTVKLLGTDFQKKVWKELGKIPHGKTWTYTQLAEKVATASAVRAVASAVAKNPVSYWVPCHRVIGKNTNILKYHWGCDTKKSLLIAEGSLKS